MNIVRKILLGIGVLAVLSGLVCGGFYYGYDYGWSKGYDWGGGVHINSLEELNTHEKKDAALNDAFEIARKAVDLAILWEERYNAALVGDNEKVIELGGQISILEKQGDEIAVKYTDKLMPVK